MALSVVMVAVALNGAVLTLHGGTGAGAAPNLGSNATPAVGTTPSVPIAAATGPRVSLGLESEVGSNLGGVPDLSAAVPLSAHDLVVVRLPFVNQSRLSAFLSAVSDPSSPSYDHFLTASQFAHRFAPASADQRAIASYLAAHGLTVAYLSPDHLSVAVRGSLAQLGGAFGVSFGMYALRGGLFYAPTSSPTVPSGLAPWISQVSGLTDYSSGMAPQLALQTAGERSAATPAPGTGVMDFPAAMTSEFQLNRLWNATGNSSFGPVPTYANGVVIATALWDLNNSPNSSAQYCPYSLTDIQQFFHILPGANPSMPSVLPSPHDHANYNISGDPGNPPGTGACAAGASGVQPNVATEELDFEMTIDQEWSGETAPGAMIEPTYVGGEGVTVTNGALSLLLSWIAAGNIPHLALLSQSFGGSESTFLESQYTELAAQGVTVLASSGDNNGAGGNGAAAVCDTGAPGEYSWNTQGSTSVEYPGSSPNVLSVGGTANLALPSPGDPQAMLHGQTVWNWCPSTDSGQSAGSTGGVSSVFAEPAYQAADPVVSKAMQWAIDVTETGNFTNGAPPTGCGGCVDITPYSPSSARAIPDLGGPAANNTGYMGGTWLSGWGGTSFSSPTIAGVLGSIVAFDGHKLGLFNPTLYALEQEYLQGQLSTLPMPVDPTYIVNNDSNAFFAGGPDYNTSSGWGVPQAYNIALLLGKPFVNTNPTGAATLGQAYAVRASVKDDRAVTHVNVSYLEPGASSWSSAPLTRVSGTGLSGAWSGAIPGPAEPGTLRYCVSAIDAGQGNSWSPYNQSAWAATGGSNISFGCTVPFTVPVNAGSAPEPVTVTETGLPTSVLSTHGWTVVLGGDAQHNTTGSVTFTEANGSYPLLVLGPNGYRSDANGTLVVSGPTSVSVGFSRGATYSLRFAEKGLGKGQAWCVQLRGDEQCSSTPKLKYTGLDPGTYGYGVVSPLAGQTITASLGKTAIAEPGSLTIAQGETVRLTFAYPYNVTFTENGLASGSWSVTIKGVTLSNATGEPITFHLTNATYRYKAGAVLGYSSSGSVRKVVVNGGAVNVTVTYTVGQATPARRVREVASLLP